MFSASIIFNVLELYHKNSGVASKPPPLLLLLGLKLRKIMLFSRAFMKFGDAPGTKIRLYATLKTLST